MTVNLGHVTYHRTAEAAEIIGISKSTLFRWIKEGVIRDSSHRDRRGWRLFTQADIKTIEEIVNKVT